MKRIFTFTIILLALAACTTPPVQTPEPTATDVPPASMPNPASVFCEQNGNKHEIRTTADGSQSGVCIFPDGSTCDEWAYFRGECGIEVQTIPTLTPTAESTSNASGGYMKPGSTEPTTDWWGIIKSTPPGAQYDDYFGRQDLGGVIYVGIDSFDPEVKAQIEAVRDSGKSVHLYGSLFSNMPDYNGSQVLVDRIEILE